MSYAQKEITTVIDKIALLSEEVSEINVDAYGEEAMDVVANAQMNLVSIARSLNAVAELILEQDEQDRIDKSQDKEDTADHSATHEDYLDHPEETV